MRFLILSILILFSIGLKAQPETRGIKPVKDTEQKTGNTWALVVGISQYADPGVPDLKYADKDALAFVKWLKSEAGGKVAEEHIKTLLNEEAKYTEIWLAFDWLKGKAKEGDVVFIYFCGHGDVNAERVDNPGYFLCHNVNSQIYGINGYNLRDLQGEVSTLNKNNKARVILISDACRAGVLAERSEGVFITNTNLSERFDADIKILSCQARELSQEGDRWGGGRGAFSYHLENALYGYADANNDSVLTLKEINRYLEDNVPVETGEKQNPVVKGDKIAVVATVNPEILAQRKMNQQIPSDVLASAGSVEKRGMPAKSRGGALTEDLLDKFQVSLDSGRLLTPEKDCANYYYEQIIQNESLADQHKAFRSKFVAALMEEGNEWMNKLVSSSLYGSEWKHEAGFGDYFEKAASLLGSENSLYSSLKGKACFFKARDFYLKNKHKAGGLASADVPEFRKLIEQGLQFDSNAAYLHFISAYQHFGPESSKADQLKGINEFKKSIELAPNWVMPHLSIAGSYSALGMHAERLEWLQKALKVDFSGAHKFLAGTVKTLESFQKKKDLFEKKPSLVNLVSFAEFCWNEGFIDEGINLSRRLIDSLQAKDKGFKPPVPLGKLYNDLGWMNLIKKDSESAKANFEKSIGKKHYYSGPSYIGLAIIADRSGLTSVRDSLIQQSWQGFYKSPFNILIDGQFLFEMYHLEEETAFLFEAACKQFPEHSLLQYELATLLLEHLADLDRGIPNMLRAIELGNDSPKARYLLASAYAASGQRDKAFENLKLSLEKGFADFKLLEADSSWDSLRNSDDYLDLLPKPKK